MDGTDRSTRGFVDSRDAAHLHESLGNGRCSNLPTLRDSSIIEALGSIEFPRIRLGVRGDGRESEPLEEYVLRPFLRDEQPIADALVEVGAEAVLAVLRDGIGAAMNRYNGLRLTETEHDSGRESTEP